MRSAAGGRYQPLAASYHFENTPGIHQDSSGNSNTASAVGGPRYTTGARGLGLMFTGSSYQAGVTSFVCSLSLSPRADGRLLDAFHSKAINLGKLAALWTSIVLKTFPGIVRVKGRPVIVGDGIKTAKEGKKMPGVKCLHQESGSNSKPPYIMGPSCRALAVLASAAGYLSRALTSA